jgi:hypothetical protein
LYPPSERTLKLLSHQDFSDGFSTLLAIKGPDIKPGYDDQNVPLQLVLAEIFGQTVDLPRPFEVYLRSGLGMKMQPQRMTDLHQ